MTPEPRGLALPSPWMARALDRIERDVFGERKGDAMTVCDHCHACQSVSNPIEVVTLQMRPADDGAWLGKAEICQKCRGGLDREATELIGRYGREMDRPKTYTQAEVKEMIDRATELRS